MSVGDASAIRALCAWASRAARDADLPARILAKAARISADNVACAIAASFDPVADSLHRRVAAVGGESRLWTAEPLCADRRNAARINAIRSNWAQLDEGHSDVMCHAGLYTVSPALAEAQAEGLGLHAALTAIALGYEITCRTALALRFDSGVPHPHAAWSAYGSAATLAALRKYGPDEWERCLGAAAAMAMAAPFDLARKGHEVIDLSAGVGVAAGFDCADAAAQGFGADAAGMLATYRGILGARFHAAPLLDGLGRSWLIERGYHKQHACARQAHAAVEALLALRARVLEAGIRPGSVRSIRLEVSPLALLLNDPEPSTVLGARFSLPHVAAVTWIQGDAGVSAFSAASLCDPAVAALRANVSLECAEEDGSRGAHGALAELVFEDGTSFSQRCDRVSGGPELPFTTADLMLKCKTLSGGALAPLFAALLESNGDDDPLAPIPL